jgi:DNA repair exonuclease SbcCD nuclease subunit
MTNAPGTASAADGIRLLALGDVHLGTRPGSLPDELASRGVDAAGLGPEAALRAAVDRALAERVDAVLFAGDVVESTNARFEALRPLEREVRRLVGSGISVLAVAGNHDVEALPRLARHMEGFQLLGQDGHWQTHRIEKPGRGAVEIVGWSFPQPRVDVSPVATLLASPPEAAAGALLRIGLLHADLDASSGAYAPVRRDELQRAGLDAWLLGHIHAPSLAEQPGLGWCGYLGSLVGLDPTETGARGPWLLRIDERGRLHAEHLPLAPLRWERIDVAVDAARTVEDVGDRIFAAASRRAQELREGRAAPRALGLRVRLVGATTLYDELRRAVESGLGRDVVRDVGETCVFVNQVGEALRLAHDLAELASGDDPPGLLARELLALERGGEAARELLDAARAALREQARDPRWQPLEEQRRASAPLDDASLAELLRGAGTALLEELLSQRDAAGGDSP